MFVGEAQFAVHGGDDALDLAHGEHPAEEGVAGVVPVRGLVHDAAGRVGEGHAVVHAHRQGGILLLEDADELDEVRPAAEVRGLGEVAVREDVAGAQVHEMGAGSELLRQVHDVVVGAC